MNVLAAARGQLEQHGYSVRSWQASVPALTFEDNTVFGVLLTFDTTRELVDRWESLQDEFARRNVVSLRTAATKAWNLYTVLLTSDAAHGEADQLTRIEENFRTSRKLVGTEIQDELSLTEALLPLLPIRNLTKVVEPRVNEEILARLARPQLTKALLAQSTSESELMQIYLDHEA